jgi:hypothetical protein
MRAPASMAPGARPGLALLGSRAASRAPLHPPRAFGSIDPLDPLNRPPARPTPQPPQPARPKQREQPSSDWKELPFGSLPNRVEDWDWAKIERDQRLQRIAKSIPILNTPLFSNKDSLLPLVSAEEILDKDASDDDSWEVRSDMWEVEEQLMMLMPDEEAEEAEAAEGAEEEEEEEEEEEPEQEHWDPLPASSGPSSSRGSPSIISSTSIGAGAGSSQAGALGGAGTAAAIRAVADQLFPPHDSTPEALMKWYLLRDAADALQRAAETGGRPGPLPPPLPLPLLLGAPCLQRPARDRAGPT